jgi:hypothetical protein
MDKWLDFLGLGWLALLMAWAGKHGIEADPYGVAGRQDPETGPGG